MTYTATHPDGTITLHGTRKSAVKSCWDNGGKVHRLQGDRRLFVVSLAARSC